MPPRGEIPENPVFRVRRSRLHAGGNGVARDVFGVHLLPRAPQGFGLQVPRHDEDAIVVRDHEVAGREQHAVYLHRHVHVDDALPDHTVVIVS